MLVKVKCILLKVRVVRLLDKVQEKLYQLSEAKGTLKYKSLDFNLTPDIFMIYRLHFFVGDDVGLDGLSSPFPTPGSSDIVKVILEFLFQKHLILCKESYSPHESSLKI